MSQTPPNAPQAPPVTPQPGVEAAPRKPSGLETYQTIADTVAGPSLRVKDNVIQAAVVIGLTIVGAVVGLVIGSQRGNAVVGAVAGGAGMMIASTLVSGLVIMVLGWMRAAKTRR